MIADLLAYAMSAILVGISCAWMYLIKSMADSFRLTPYLDRFEDTSKDTPRVSVILPARNEERFLPGCLDSLEDQDYEDYEVIVVDDSSEDGTGGIMRRRASASPKIIPVSASPKPEGWIGKNWACMEGYRRASGELLLFTDADATYSRSAVRLAARHLGSEGLDALSVIPRIRLLDFVTRITMPMIAVFLHTRFSALKVNDPAAKTGYFFGSFFIIRKKTYEDVGMHEGVRHEIVEDGALGKKVKEAGHRMRMVRGEHLIQAVWARDRRTLWNALKRLVVPIYLQSAGMAMGITAALAFLLSVPFIAAAAALALQTGSASWTVFCITAVTASAAIYAGAAVEARFGLGLGLRYVLLAPAGGLVVVSGFLAGLAHAKSSTSVSWRGRTYSMSEHARSSLDV